MRVFIAAYNKRSTRVAYPICVLPVLHISMTINDNGRKDEHEPIGNIVV